MTQLKLAKFPSRPEDAVALMTLNDAWFLISNGQLSIEGAQYLFPQESWEYLPQKSSQPIAVKCAA
ncbi:MAG: hypothetical protein HC852_01975 [Acaryochloridaceae cyanobacterium RU_4_10]|nr:hypothetical protein [Acaryochloridaceae cyanobacterium RU_4_10]